ncbi:tyrosine-type recombinase/integrase [Yoonia sp. 208BN28-4]|uniref:tyrosine-type recombinase/integrase n=1 Tax=Yoonia sp. 208BN28-4 TaxID=3126505 RepID=UPI0030A5434F
MKKKLTSRYVETVTTPGPKRLEVYDQTLTGFGIRISTSGRKTWFCSTRSNGSIKRVTIGTFPALALSDAREQAKIVIHDAQLDLADQVEVQTLGEVVPLFITLYAKPRNRGWKDQERLLKQKWKPLFKKRLNEIKRTDAVRVLDQMIADGAPGRANHAMAVLKKLLNWSVDRGMIEVNPISGMSPPTKPRPRDRILTDPEITRFMQASTAQGYPFGTIQQMLLLTGQRRAEVSEMKWAEINFETNTWNIPAERAKNGQSHNVPLSTPVQSILTSLPHFAGSEYVFTTTGKSPVSGFGRAKERIDVAVGASDWRLHDLRRTAASGMARIKVSPHVIEKVLNHKTGIISGVAAVYNRYSYEEEKREALELWANQIESLCRETKFSTSSKAA